MSQARLAEEVWDYERPESSAERAVFVGDIPTDLTAARAADLVALGALWGWHSAAALARRV
ncbi:hypothetical protein ACIQ6V_31940 [Streptomyces sp. NPDC096198]|uniref:hypothetical protein n=1 Tax=Streptomyces sp. NPDC096198 TaxID=3366080 RepID=UPI003815C9FB